MRKLGIPEEQLRADREARQKAAREAAQSDSDDEVRIAPHLAQVVWFFSKLRTHWRAVANGQGRLVWLGLDWAAVDATMRRRDVKPTRPDRFHDWLDVLDVEGVRIKNGV